MAARTKIKVGKSTATPSTGVNPPRKEKNQQKPGVATPAQAPPDRAAVQAALGDAQRLGTALAPALRAPPATGRGSTVTRTRQGHLPMLVALLRAHPDLAPAVDPDKLDQQVGLGGDLQQLSIALHDLVAQVDGSYQATVKDAWKAGQEIYHVAQVRAETDGTIAQAIAPLQADLAHGPRVKTRPRTVASANANSATLQKRAAKAQRQADRAKLAATMADALAEARKTDTVPAVTVTPPASPTHT